MRPRALAMPVVALLLFVPACSPVSPANPATADQLVGKWEALPSKGMPAGAREVWEFKQDGTYSITGEAPGKPPHTITGQYHVNPQGGITTDHSSQSAADGVLAKGFTVQGDALTMTAGDGTSFGFRRAP
jgi:hypothetical protein